MPALRQMSATGMPSALEEVRLFRLTFAGARVPNKRLLLTAGYVESGSVWR
jgi:hypothetical protein